MPSEPTKRAPERMYGNIFYLARREIKFRATRRGVWRTPIGSLAKLTSEERELLARFNSAGRRVAEMIRSAPNA